MAFYFKLHGSYLHKVQTRFTKSIGKVTEALLGLANLH